MFSGLTAVTEAFRLPRACEGYICWVCNSNKAHHMHASRTICCDLRKQRFRMFYLLTSAFTGNFLYIWHSRCKVDYNCEAGLMIIETTSAACVNLILFKLGLRLTHFWWALSAEQQLLEEEKKTWNPLLSNDCTCAHWSAAMQFE